MKTNHIKSHKILKTTLKLLLIVSVIIPLQSFSQNITAKEIVKKADEKWQGLSNENTMTMTIVRPSWKRTVKFKSWIKGRDYSLTLINYPAKDKGQTFLKRKNDMWSWNPTISRLIKLSPSMMSQGWMGSDYTNDDILKESSIVKDYNHKIISKVKISGRVCYKIQLTPKEDAAVVWGKIIKYISGKILF